MSTRILIDDLVIHTEAATGAECRMMGELTLVLLEKQGKAGGLLRYRCERRETEG